jgi:hypothetical protein
MIPDHEKVHSHAIQRTADELDLHLLLGRWCCVPRLSTGQPQSSSAPVAQPSIPPLRYVSGDSCAVCRHECADAARLTAAPCMPFARIRLPPTDVRADVRFCHRPSEGSCNTSESACPYCIPRRWSRKFGIKTRQPIASPALRRAGTPSLIQQTATTTAIPMLVVREKDTGLI